MPRHQEKLYYRGLKKTEDYFKDLKQYPDIDSKTKEQTDYLFSLIEPFLEDSRDNKDVKKIIYKILKVFNQGK